MKRAALILATLAILTPRCVHTRERFTVWDARYILTHPVDPAVCTLPPAWDALDRFICRSLTTEGE